MRHTKNEMCSLTMKLHPYSALIVTTRAHCSYKLRIRAISLSPLCIRVTKDNARAFVSLKLVHKYTNHKRAAAKKKRKIASTP